MTTIFPERDEILANAHSTQTVEKMSDHAGIMYLFASFLDYYS